MVSNAISTESASKLLKEKVMGLLKVMYFQT